MFAVLPQGNELGESGAKHPFPVARLVERTRSSRINL